MTGNVTGVRSSENADMRNERPSAAWIRDQLLKIEREKRAHVGTVGKLRPAHWHQEYADAIKALQCAAEGYAKLASREAAE